MNYFEYNDGSIAMGDVVPFEKPTKKREFEHVDSTTTVERIEMTDELKQAFENAGYDVEETA